MESRSYENNSPHIITHNGPFHLDDVISCYMLKKIYPNAKITRSRDHGVIASGDIVVDVGDTFCVERRRFDHHQRGFHETYSEDYAIKLSSSGLIFKYFGKEFLSAIGIHTESESEMKVYKDILYRVYFVSVDAHDNGVEIAEKSAYNLRTLDDMVKSLVPACPEATFEEAEIIRRKAFDEAMIWMGKDLERTCHQLYDQVIRNMSAVKSAFSMGPSDALYIIMNKGYTSRELVYYFNRIFKRKVSVIINRRLG
ncbi:uncharacterized protein NEMAJ01_2403, partial [Nematocida major]|uniref:uncharacterized protein n=1 Tax=Nematocida major TaxID=1912982 RepID=UPI0020082D5B